MSFNPIRQEYYEKTGYTTKTCENCGFAHGDHECMASETEFDTEDFT